MKKPSALTYVGGNVVVLTGAWLGVAVTAYQAFSGAITLFVPLILLAVAGSCLRAADQVTKYQQWHREWNAMEGVAPRPGGSLRLPRLPNLRVIGGVIFWLLAACFVLAHGGDGGAMSIAALLFWVGSGALAFRGAVLWTKRGRRAPAARDGTVAQCLPVAGATPGLQQSYEALPAYCMSLFRAGG